MPFAPKTAPSPATFKAGDDVYINDPDVATNTYRAVIESIEEDVAKLWLWPGMDRPIYQKLHEDYRISLPVSELRRTPDLDRKWVGYGDALEAAGLPFRPWWDHHNREWLTAQTYKVLQPTTWGATPPASTPAPAATATAPAAAASKSTIDRPPRDGQFGLAGVSTLTPPPAGAPTPPAAAPAAPAPAQPPTLAAGPERLEGKTFIGIVGMPVQVLPNAGHSFWAPLAGKQGIISEVAPDGLVSVEIEGYSYPGVDTRRLTPVEAQQPAPPVVDNRVAAAQLVGQLVSVRPAVGESVYNGFLEQVTEQGIVMLGGKLSLKWDEIRSIEVFDAAKHVAGAIKPPKAKKEKAPKAPKSDAPAGAAPPAPPAAASAPAQEAVQQTIAPVAPEAPKRYLKGDVILFLDEALKGKVTRKVLEEVRERLVNMVDEGHHPELGAPAVGLDQRASESPIDRIRQMDAEKLKTTMLGFLDMFLSDPASKALLGEGASA